MKKKQTKKGGHPSTPSEKQAERLARAFESIASSLAVLAEHIINADPIRVKLSGGVQAYSGVDEASFHVRMNP